MNLQELSCHPRVRVARSVVHRLDDETIREQARLVAIPAPTGDEGERAAYMLMRFGELGVVDPYVDEVGNVLGWLEGASPSRRERPIVVAAHLDTIFPAGTELRVRREGERLHAPGIADNARGLAALLTVLRALGEAGVTMQYPVLLVATVGEEGAGDLRGVKHLFRGSAELAGSARAFVSIDGPGLSRIVHRAVGSRRARVTFRGAGGHSWGDRGSPNPVNAAGDAIVRLRKLAAAHVDEGAVNVGRIGGGTSVNSIPAEAWLDLDLRSEAPMLLEDLERRAIDIMERAAREEGGAGRARQDLEVTIDWIGDRPSGATPENSPVVVAALEVTRLLGATPELVASSTDANVPISLGIPAVSVGAGGHAGGIHTAAEWFENRDGALGVERALLLLLALAGIREQAHPAAGSPSTTE